MAVMHCFTDGTGVSSASGHDWAIDERKEDEDMIVSSMTAICWLGLAPVVGNHGSATRSSMLRVLEEHARIDNWTLDQLFGELTIRYHQQGAHER